jgi:hypothetical protein
MDRLRWMTLEELVEEGKRRHIILDAVIENDSVDVVFNSSAQGTEAFRMTRAQGWAFILGVLSACQSPSDEPDMLGRTEDASGSSTQ